MYYLIITIILLSNVFIHSKVISGDKIVIKSIKIDSGRGFSFKNMTIMFNKKRNAKDIIKDTFNDPKYKFSDCKSNVDTQDCIIIKDSNFK